MATYAAGQIVTDAELNTGSAQVDLTAYTVSATGLSQASKIWDIPANSSTGGSSWRLTVIGSFTQGTTVEGNNWYMGMGPSAATQVEIVQATSGNYAASAISYWTVIIHFVVNVGGASGTASIWGTMATGDATSHNITWTNGAINSFNTTVDNGLCFLYDWASNVGSPTLTSYFSIFERMS